MSLKSFHLVFISLSVFLFFGFGFWNVDQAETSHLVWGIFSFLAGGFLLVYGIYFFRKTFLSIIMLLSFFQASKVIACATCFGDPNSLQTQGMNMAILFLLILTTIMLVSFFVFFVYLWRASKKKIS